MSLEVKVEIILDVVVTGDYTPAKDGQAYTRGGDPGDAPEGSEFEIAKVLLGGQDITKALEAIGFDFASLADQCREEVEND